VRWVFDVGENHSKAVDFTAFMLLGVVGLGLNQLLMWLFVSEAGIHYMVSKLFVTAIVMVYNFITRKLVLERKATGK
jgi:putative flippase GtrA